MVLQMVEQLQAMFQSPERITTQALQSAYAIWAKRYPEWVATFFDEHFLHAHVIPRFSAGQTPTATALAEAWVTQMGTATAQSAKLIDELTPVAADFLYVVQSERCFFQEKADRHWHVVRRIAGVLGSDTRVRRAKGFS